MSPLASLGTFLTLSFLLPGIIIFSALVILFPDSYTLIEHRSTIELLALVLVISFLNGHLAFMCEIYVLNRFWDKIQPSLQLSRRSQIMADRSKIIASAEANNISHLHLDVIFGEFVLYTNTSFWVLIIAFVKFCKLENLASSVEAIFVVLASFVILTFTSPLFKHQYLSALEIIKEKNDIRDTLPPPSSAGANPSGAASSSQSGGSIPDSKEDHHMAHSPEGHHDVLQTGPDEITTGDLA